MSKRKTKPYDYIGKPKPFGQLIADDVLSKTRDHYTARKLVSDKPKPTTQAERRKIYAKNRRAHSKVNVDVENMVLRHKLVERVAKLENDQTDHINVTGANLNRANIEIRAMETRVKMLEQTVQNQSKQIDELSRAMTYRMTDIEVAAHKLSQRVDNMTKQLWDSREKTPSYGKGHVIGNEAAKSIYEIEKLLGNAINSLKTIRNS